RYISCLDAGRWGPADGITFVDDARVVALHDRDLVLGGPAVFRRLLDASRGLRFLTVREAAQRQEAGRDP
ncbi:MAG: hypothetical protein HY725_22245, partial [Candidatus Rokubacteria bacterium]|nr:hypothetical protein [Candidatus Rokubacteria bacterium]